MENKMFCIQCEESANCTGCTKIGVCGKTSDVANLQDKLIYLIKKIAKENKTNESDKFIIESLFATITNVNFDKNYFIKKIEEGKKFVNVSEEELNNNYSILKEENIDIRSLKELLIYGLKGLAAYLYHANVLGYQDNDINNFIREALSATLENKSLDELTSLVLKCGEFGVKTLALLDKANTTSFGIPNITKVNLSAGNLPGILISGHDLKDMEDLLNQTKDQGIDVYTHGEMLVANSYPEFRIHNHFKGNYGGSWYMQQEEFEKFNGPILMTTNCLVPPKDSYKDRVYTTGLVGFEGLKHIKENEGKKDFSKIIEHAKKCMSPINIEDKEIIIGFNHNVILSLADKIIDAVKKGKIKKFIVMAGCDGRQIDREYYTEFAKSLPTDTIILTAGCAKYRYNKLDLGDIDGIPRVIDAGQCNDSYSLCVVALKLKEALGLEDINDLPISYNVAWYEQKAVLVLLALLSLGVKNIRLGPKLPAFISPNILNLLVNNFNIAKNTTVEEDIKLLV